MAGVLAIDHGEKRTGFAVADALHISVQPLGTLPFGGQAPELLDHIAGLLEEREVDTVVVGLPLNMDGSEGPRARSVRSFMEQLSGRFPELDILGQDERLSTVEADEMLLEAGHRGRHRKARRDSWSALVILRDWLAERE